jgi:Family of unknown function (DUF6545)
MSFFIPAVVAWPVIAFMACVVCARFRWCNINLYDTYANNTLLLVLFALLLHDHSVQNFLSQSAFIDPATAQQLGAAATIFAAAEFGGFIVLRSALSMDETCRRHRYYRLGAWILCAAFLAAATRARVAGQTLEAAKGWDCVIAWAFYLTMLLFIAAQIILMSVSELRKQSCGRELIVGFALLLLGISIGAVSLEALSLSMTDQLGWTRTVSFRQGLDVLEFLFESFFLGTIGAIPLAANLLAYLGLDTTSRLWHNLQPLRQGMLTAVPAGILEANHEDHRFRKTTLQLHQTVIEIRDAMLGLRPYIGVTATGDVVRFLQTHSVPTQEQDSATHALYLAQAAKAKITGAEPGPLGTAPILRSGSTTLDAEAVELFKLAKWWPAACAATGY